MVVGVQVGRSRLLFSHDWADQPRDRARLVNINVPGPSRYGTDLGMTHRKHGAPVTYRCGDEVTAFPAEVVEAVSQMESASSWAAAKELADNWNTQ